MIKHLFLVLALMGLTTARRLPNPTSENPVDLQKMGKSFFCSPLARFTNLISLKGNVQKYLLIGSHGWGYPYGWGLDMPMSGEFIEDHKAVKQVKQVKKEIKKEEETPKEHRFLWGVDHVSDLDDMCGLE
jgi:hypothetical protein